MTEQTATVEFMTDDELYEYRRKLIKDTFTEDDFLSCDKTRQILEDEFFWDWEKRGEPKVEQFYQGIRKEMQGKYSTPLFYDIDGEFGGKLTDIVFSHLKKEYDISVFHDCPDLAEPLIQRYDEIQEAKKEALKARRNQSTGIGIKTNKKFDWATKTYK